MKRCPSTVRHFLCEISACDEWVLSHVCVRTEFKINIVTLHVKGLDENRAQSKQKDMEYSRLMLDNKENSLV